MAFNGKPRRHQLLSPQARYARAAAEACGYDFRSLDGADGYLFEVSDGGRRALFAAGAGTPYALNDARAASIARDKAFCAGALRRAGLPVVAGEMFFVTDRWREMRGPGRELEDARAYVAQRRFPIFCKPISASNGQFAEVIESAGAFADYAARVSREHFAILVQPYVRADEHRVFVLNGEALFSYRKSLPSVIGDGKSTLQELANACASGDLAARAPFADDGRRVSMAAVPEPGRRIVFAGAANRASGGGANGVRDGAPEAMARLAVRAANVLGLRLAAIDLFDLCGDGSDLAVIEVNSNPMIATLEDAGRWDLIVAIWRANFDAALR